MLDRKLDFWLKNNLNVVLEGERGTGKTAQILECFKRNKVPYLYFSASTMDPFLHLLGIPKEVQNEKGQSYLEFIKPKELQFDQVEAIYFDEMNRASPRVLNSILEILQFKSVNGQRFKNLRVCWAAINPKDDDNKYQVEALDPAHIDRFHVYYKVPYFPDANYFRQKYGQDLADNAINWWMELDLKIRKEISPRRLDYALEMYRLGGELRDILPYSANISKLSEELANGSISKRLPKIFSSKNKEEAKKFLAIENNYSACIQNILWSKTYSNFFLPLLPEEKLSSLLPVYKKVENFVWSNHESYKDLIELIIRTKSSRGLPGRFCKKILSKIQTTPDFTWTLIFCQGDSSPGLAKRKIYLDLLEKSFPSELTDQQAKTLFKVLLSILDKSKISEHDKIIPMFNKTCVYLEKHNINLALPEKVLKNLQKNPQFTCSIPKNS